MHAQESVKQKTIILLLISLLPLCISRLLFSLFSPINTYGYDYGFYRYAVIHAASISWSSFLSGTFGGYNNPLFFVFHVLHIPVDAGLMGSIFLAAILLGVAIFFHLKKYSLTGATLGVLITAVSIAQSEAYSMFLWKTVLALPLFVWALTALRDKQYKTLAIATALLLIIHRTSALVFIITAASYLLWTAMAKKNWRQTAIVCGGFAILAVCLYHPLTVVWYNIAHNPSVQEGIFLFGENLWLIVLPTVMVSALGLYLAYKHKVQTPAVALFFISLLWIIFKLPFYHRIILYLDISTVLLSAYSLSVLWRTYGPKIKLAYPATIIVILFLGYRGTMFVVHKAPLINPKDLEEIQNFHPTGPAPFVAATSSSDAPWLLGYLSGARLAAPGLFEDRHTEAQWNEFWSGSNQQPFLSTFPRPLYLYTRSFPIDSPCLKPISPNFSQYTCE